MKKTITIALVLLSINAQAAWELIKYEKDEYGTNGYSAVVKQVSDEGNSILTIGCTGVSREGNAFVHGMTIRPYNSVKNIEYGKEQNLSKMVREAHGIMVDGSTLVWNGGEQHYSGVGFKEQFGKAEKHCGQPYEY